MISRIENARFNTTRFGPGYDEEEVDKFLDVLVRALSDGALDPAMVREKKFSVTRLRPGYNQEDVDALLDDVGRYASGYR